MQTIAVFSYDLYSYQLPSESNDGVLDNFDIN